MKFYGYDNCSTCKKAENFLKDNKLNYEKFDITNNPPDQATLKSIIDKSDYKIKDLFNKSGLVYRELNMKDKIDHMSEPELLKLLSENGRLIKRPILINDNKFAVGFKEDIFKSVVK